ncbi:hypothetical protein [Fredinandcohnia sp. 179-A 10B2 NHS]|uniref:hypothetical protein n=1 Tax=Fredinandcohnia sp. 179-A 10B2 NHS TaxID=3235176 RepID=UPI00399F19D7
MRNKKIILLILIISIIGSIFLLNYFFTTSSTYAIVTVLEKGYSEDNDEAWITVVPPNTDIEYQNEYKIKITVKELMVWNLIEKDQTYSVNYKKRKNVKTLNYIKYVDDDQAILYHNAF